MKKSIIIAVMALLLSSFTYGQVGIGTKTPATDAILDLTATEKAMLVPRVANTAAVTAPVNGMIIYDISSGCIKSYQSGAWTECNATTSPTVGAIDCANVLISGTLTASIPANNVSATIPYTGANGGNYTGQIVSSTGVTGLTAAVAGGVLVNGDGTVIYTITGTPSGPGTASFAITLIDKTCTFTISVAQSVPQVTTLDCLQAVVSGIPTANEFTNGVFVSVPYTGGNATAYEAQSIASTGVLGLSAFLAPSTLANGNGTLVFQLSGTPAGGGVASFELTLGGQSCSFTVNIASPPTISSWANCSSATAGSLVVGLPASGVTQTATYNGGNGVSYPATSITSAGVTGLIANLAAGVLANGNSNVIFTITGTPTTSDTAIFNLTLFGASCTFTRTVEPPTVAGLTCGSAVFSPAVITQGVAYSGTVTVPYTGGNGAPYPSGSAINSTTVNGLTATLQAGTLAVGGGNLTYTVAGTATSSGNANFALSFGGQTCTLTTAVNAPFALTCNSTSAAPSTFTSGVAYNGTLTVPYTGGNGTAYAAGAPISSTGVTGLTATLVAGTLSSGSGNFTLNVTGTPTTSGNASFAFSFGGQSCSIVVNVAPASPVITGLTCGSPTVSGTVTKNQSAAGTTVQIVYSGGNGASYAAGTTINSTGVTGLTATLQAGTLSNSTGNFVLNLSGTPTTAGTASFAFSFGGQNCTIDIPVVYPLASSCATATISVTPCSAVSGATLNDNSATADGIEYNWTGATTSNMANTSTTRALVEINGQCWMRYDMRATSSQGPTANFSYYTGGPFTNEGRLYERTSAYEGPIVERTKGVCPTGWHIPSDCEWQYLESSLGMTQAELEGGVNRTTTSPVGTKLKSGGSSGFNFLLQGFRNASGGLYVFRGTRGVLYSSTISNVRPIIRTVQNTSTTVGIGTAGYNGVTNFHDHIAVRCIKD